MFSTCAWCRSQSKSAVASTASLSSSPQSLKYLLLVRITLPGVGTPSTCGPDAPEPAPFSDPQSDYSTWYSYHHARFQGLQRKAYCQVRLSDTRRPKQNHVFVSVCKRKCRQFIHLPLINTGLEGKIKILQGFSARKSGQFQSCLLAFPSTLQLLRDKQLFQESVNDPSVQQLRPPDSGNTHWCHIHHLKY